MGRGLSTSEKRLVLVLLIAVIGGGYFFFFHENMERRIQEAEIRKAEETILYEFRSRQINELPGLRAFLQELINMPDYADMFFSATENQEVFMEFLHDLIVDNELLVEGIVFDRHEINLYEFEELAIVLEEYLTNIEIERENIVHEGILPFLNVISANMTFFVEASRIDSLLSALDMIEQSEKMIFCGDLLLEVVEIGSIPPELRTVELRELLENPEAYDHYMALQCSAYIRFVNFVDVFDQAAWHAIQEGGSAVQEGAVAGDVVGDNSQIPYDSEFD